MMYMWIFKLLIGDSVELQLEFGNPEKLLRFLYLHGILKKFSEILIDLSGMHLHRGF